MPIIKREASNGVPNPQPNIKQYSSISVDSQVEHRRNLLTHVEGSKWIVQYYHQITTADTEVAAQEVNRSGAYQQYLKVFNFELRATSPLTASLNTEGQEFSHVGESLVFPGTLIPNKGDMIVADIGDGRAGLLVVSEAEQLSVLRDAGYRISYGLKSYADGLLLADLEDKVVKTGHFIKDFLAIGRNPILVPSEYQSLMELRMWLQRIPEDYFTNFFNREFNTLLVPDQQPQVYDPFLTEFIAKIFSSDVHPQYMNLNLLNCDTADPERFETIWTALETLDDRALQFGEHEMTICTTKGFWQHPRFAAIRFSSIPEFLLPKGCKSAEPVDLRKFFTESPIRTPKRPLDIANVIYTADLQGLHIDGTGEEPYVIPIIHPLPQEFSYVFSNAFYQRNVVEMSLLEQMVYKRLNDVPVDLGQLLRICNTSIGWKALERFYYVPVLYVLVMSAIGDIN